MSSSILQRIKLLTGQNWNRKCDLDTDFGHFSSCSKTFCGGLLIIMITSLPSKLLQWNISFLEMLGNGMKIYKGKQIRIINRLSNFILDTP